MSERDLISVADAIAIIDATPVAPRILRAHLESVQGLRLAQDLISDRDYPPFDKSLMDGYAVRCADVATTPVELNLVGEIAAGQRTARPLGSGEAFAIMTGAPIPEGADGVVPIEDTQLVPPLPPGEGRGEGGLDDRKASDSPHPLTLALSRRERGPEARVRILRADAPARFITPRGADCAAGSVVLKRGTKLEAAQLAVAASVGASRLDVFAAPSVAVLSTGDELVSVDATPGPAQIRNSNNIMLSALLRRLGCDVTDLGIARDDPATIRNAIERGLTFDALFVSGGMSMGQYDFVPKVLQELGVELKITKLRIKPGKPFVFGVRGASTKAPRFVFGLPGNPVSSFVCALRLCSRIIARLGGAEVVEKLRPAILESPLEPNGTREFYQPAILNGGSVQPLKWKGSADIYTLARANGLIIRAENAPAVPSGATVEVLEIPA